MEWQICRISAIIEQAEQLALLLPAERQAQLAKITHQGRKEAALCSEWLARQMLAKAAQIPPEQIEISRSEKGKPYAPALPFHFNISHSGDFIACALSNAPIGIDLELRAEPDLKLARRLCTPQDLLYLRPEEADAPLRLLEIWVAKEAYFKAIGSGITDLKSIHIQELLPRLKQIRTEEYLLAIYQ